MPGRVVRGAEAAVGEAAVGVTVGWVQPTARAAALSASPRQPQAFLQLLEEGAGQELPWKTSPEGFPNR